MNVISVKNLTFAYEKDKNVLENLSLDIKENTINAILGSIGEARAHFWIAVG